MNLSFVLERKKRLQSLVLQALAGLFPGAAPIGGLLPICFFFLTPILTDPFQPSTVPSPLPPPPPAPPEEHRGSDPRGPAPPGPAEGRQTSGSLSAGKQTSTDIPVYLILVGKGASRGAHRPPFPTPSSQRRKSQDSGYSSGGLAGISALDLGLIITAWLLLLLLFLFYLREKDKKKPQNQKPVGFI